MPPTAEATKEKQFKQIQIDAEVLSKLMKPDNDGFETLSWYWTCAAIMERMCVNWFGVIPEKPTNWTSVKWVVQLDYDFDDSWNLRVYIERRPQKTGPDKYAIIWSGSAWTKEGIWELELSKDVAYLERARYDSFQEAETAAKEGIEVLKKRFDDIKNKSKL